MNRFIYFLFLLIHCVGCKKESSNDIKKEIKDTVFVQKDSFMIKKYHIEPNKIVEEIGINRDDIHQINIYINQDTIDYKLFTDGNYYTNQQIVWRSKDYIFVRKGCGSPCWNGLLLNLNKKELKIYPFYYFADKDSQVIVYPDENDSAILVLDDFGMNIQKTKVLDICDKVVHPLFAIDTIYKINNNSIQLKYLDSSCDKKKEIVIEY